MQDKVDRTKVRSRQVRSRQHRKNRRLLLLLPPLLLLLLDGGSLDRESLRERLRRLRFFGEELSGLLALRDRKMVACGDGDEGCAVLGVLLVGLTELEDSNGTVSLVSFSSSVMGGIRLISASMVKTPLKGEGDTLYIVCCLCALWR